MNRFQKKCLFASAMMHGLLAVVLIFGTAFFDSKKETLEPPQIIEIINPNVEVTDGATRGGGTPAPPPEPQPVPIQRPPEPVRQPDPVPAVQQPVVPPPPKTETKTPPVAEAIKPEVVKTRPTPPKVEKTVTPPPPKRKIDIGKQVVRKTDTKSSSVNTEKLAQDRAQAQRAAAIAGSLKKLNENLSSSTTIQMSGSGGDGQAAINYGDYVLSKYDAAWFAPAEVDDNEAIAKARVVIARNGNVISATIIKPSGNALLDQSVRRALELKFIKEFPPGSKDSQRTYIINFNLKSKRGIG